MKKKNYFSFFYLKKKMALKKADRWYASAAVAGAALIIFHPFTYWGVDFIFGNKGWIAEEKGKKPTMWGLMLHVIVLFFAVIGIMYVPWSCE